MVIRSVRLLCFVYLLAFFGPDRNVHYLTYKSSNRNIALIYS